MGKWTFGARHCVVIALVLGCSCGDAMRLAQNNGSTEAPSTAFPELEAALAGEFKRLGIDPGKVPSRVASGAENTVFDLELSPEGTPVTAMRLSWTERLIGDYDQNGLVNISDISPLGQFFQNTVQHDPPALHGGIEYWPLGDPDGAGADNWRKARIDGDDNGELNISDITPIASHWNERLSGYRLYLKSPGAEDFEFIPDPASPGSELSCARADLDFEPLEPVRYRLELPLEEPGVYELYIAGFDESTGMEGAASAIVSIDTNTGAVNRSPVALLRVSPDFAGAPAQITFDASDSYDLDGSILAYEWDLDGDGVSDWLSTDPLPEQSSDGTVTGIVSAGAGRVTATYTTASNEYLNPTVTAADDAGAESTADAELGISGWVDSEHIWSELDSTFSFEPTQYHYNDVTQQPVCIGTGLGQRSLYYAQRTGLEQWQEELVYDMDHPTIEPFVGELGIPFHDVYVAFKQNGEPVLFIWLAWGTGLGWSSAIFIAEKEGGSWGVELLYQSPAGFTDAGCFYVSELGHDHFQLLCQETNNTTQPDGSKVRYFIADYNEGIITIEDLGLSGIFNDEKYQMAETIQSGPAGTSFVEVFYAEWSSLTPQVHLLRREAANDWQMQVMEFDQFPELSNLLRVDHFIVGPADELTLAVQNHAGRYGFNDGVFLLGELYGVEKEPLKIETDYLIADARIDFASVNGIGVSYRYREPNPQFDPGFPEPTRAWTEFRLYEPTQTLTETVVRIPDAGVLEYAINAVIYPSSNNLMAIVRGEMKRFSDGGIGESVRGAFIRERLDPRGPLQIK